MNVVSLKHAALNVGCVCLAVAEPLDRGLLHAESGRECVRKITPARMGGQPAARPLLRFRRDSFAREPHGFVARCQDSRFLWGQTDGSWAFYTGMKVSAPPDDRV